MISHNNAPRLSRLQEPMPSFACLAAGTVQASSELAGETIHCTSGHLWVTVEGDGVDHILMAGESLSIPNTGKVVIGGPGCYQLGQDPMDLRRAS